MGTKRLPGNGFPLIPLLSPYGSKPKTEPPDFCFLPRRPRRTGDPTLATWREIFELQRFRSVTSALGYTAYRILRQFP